VSADTQRAGDLLNSVGSEPVSDLAIP